MHVYISSQGASALPNHTDVTEIVVLQLLGRKEWLYCREKPPSAAAAAATALFPLEAKLDKCRTYSAAEVDSDALECERAVTSWCTITMWSTMPLRCWSSASHRRSSLSSTCTTCCFY